MKLVKKLNKKDFKKQLKTEILDKIQEKWKKVKIFYVPDDFKNGQELTIDLGNNEKAPINYPPETKAGDRLELKLEDFAVNILNNSQTFSQFLRNEAKNILKTFKTKLFKKKDGKLKIKEDPSKKKYEMKNTKKLLNKYIIPSLTQRLTDAYQKRLDKQKKKQEEFRREEERIAKLLNKEKYLLELQAKKDIEFNEALETDIKMMVQIEETLQDINKDFNNLIEGNILIPGQANQPDFSIDSKIDNINDEVSELSDLLDNEIRMLDSTFNHESQFEGPGSIEHLSEETKDLVTIINQLYEDLQDKLFYTNKDNNEIEQLSIETDTLMGDLDQVTNQFSGINELVDHDNDDNIQQLSTETDTLMGDLNKITNQFNTLSTEMKDYSSIIDKINTEVQPEKRLSLLNKQIEEQKQIKINLEEQIKTLVSNN
jgi:hypothetical protein